jgi:hypothetical protein
MRAWPFFALVFVAVLFPALAHADDDARTKQLRLLCAQLSGDLTEPGGLAAFKRCLTQDPLSAMKQNAFGVRPAGPPPAPPKGFGRDSRQLIANAVAKFQAVDKMLYVLATDGKLWRATISGRDGKVVETNVASFHALDATTFYAVDPNGKLRRGTGDVASRHWVDDEVSAFQPIDATSVYVLGRDAKLWRETGDMHNRVLVDTDVAAFQAIDAVTVFVRSKDGKVWRDKGTKADRTLIASNVIDFRATSDGIYVLVSDNALWHQSGDKQEQISAGVRAFEPADAHNVYVLAPDGKLWRGQNMTAPGELVDMDLLAATDARPFQAIDAEHVYVLGNDHSLWAETMPPRHQ